MFTHYNKEHVIKSNKNSIPDMFGKTIEIMQPKKMFNKLTKEVKFTLQQFNVNSCYVFIKMTLAYESS